MSIWSSIWSIIWHMGVIITFLNVIEATTTPDVERDYFMTKYMGGTFMEAIVVWRYATIICGLLNIVFTILNAIQTPISNPISNPISDSVSDSVKVAPYMVRRAAQAVTNTAVRNRRILPTSANAYMNELIEGYVRKMQPENVERQL